MSRLGKKEISIPEGVMVRFVGKTLTVSGPKGTLEFVPKPEVLLKIVDTKIQVKVGSGKTSSALQGTTRQIIAQMVKGVSSGWAKTLEVVGTGYRATLEGEKLVLSLGFSHKVEIASPSGITFQVAENKITLSGADKFLVGETAAKIRKLRPPDPYKGKGIRYLGEKVRLKPGKAAKTGVPVSGLK